MVHRQPRPWLRFLLLASVGLTAVATSWLLSRPGPIQAQIKREQLRPGVVATYRDRAKNPVALSQLEPTIALALKAGESPHPRLAAAGGTVRYQGYLNILRGGSYQFSVLLHGKVKLTVAGKEVLNAAATGDAAVLKDGPETKLEAGVHELVGEFEWPPGPARLQVFWKSPYFMNEPLPAHVVRHVPAKVPAQLAADRRAERGRFLAEEMSCTSCHRPEDRDRIGNHLQTRQGPDLSKVGGRTQPGWIYQWLTAGHEQFPGRVMPKMFSDDEAGRTEAFAVTKYLATLGGPPLKPGKPNPSKALQDSIKRGQRLFATVGCLSCHRPAKDYQANPGTRTTLYDLASDHGSRNYPLHDLGAKTTPPKLAEYLADPLAVDPSGRMPRLLLDGKESLDLANYLCLSKSIGKPAELPAPPAKKLLAAAFQRVDRRPDELAEFQKLPPAKQLLDLGKRLVIARGCNNCHQIAPDGQPFANVYANADFSDLQNPKSHDTGCLATDAGKRGQAPRYQWAEADRQALTTFLREGATGAGAPSGPHAARVTLQRFNCLACHSRDGDGGLSLDLIQEIRKYEKEENGETVQPPNLTGVGGKLRTPWLNQVLTQAGRARPWMALRMPQFGKEHVGHLSAALAALEGAEPDDRAHQTQLTPAKIQQGRLMIGKAGFGCVSCHDIAGQVSGGTRGPDLATTTTRVRYDWYRRWLESAQRMDPDTKMPTVFPEGRSLLDKVLNGNANAQADAMWAYLSLGPTLPLPPGLEPSKGMILTVGDRPRLLRTFLQDAGTKAVAVGYPGNVSTVFDSSTCRLAYGWTGNFLDASSVWGGRGGAPAKVMGARFWTAPAGCPWGVNDSKEPPDFAAQASDPAYGAALPEGKVFEGQQQLFFEGYQLDKNGLPTFRYRLNAGGGQHLTVGERPEPLHSGAGVGLSRHFTLTIPRKQAAWLFAAEATKTPRVLDVKGQPVAVNLQNGEAELLAAGQVLLLPQTGDRMHLLRVTAAPPGSRWLLRRTDETWRVLLRVPAPQPEAAVQVRLQVWTPYRDDPALLKELLAGK